MNPKTVEKIEKLGKVQEAAQRMILDLVKSGSGRQCPRECDDPIDEITAELCRLIGC